MLHGFSATEEKRDTTASRCIGGWDFGDEAKPLMIQWSEIIGGRNFDDFFDIKQAEQTVFKGRIEFIFQGNSILPKQKNRSTFLSPQKGSSNPEGRETPEAKLVIRSWDLSRVHCRFYLKMVSHHPSFILKLCSLAIPVTLGGLTQVVEDGYIADFLRGKWSNRLDIFGEMMSISGCFSWLVVCLRVGIEATKHLRVVSF